MATAPQTDTVVNVLWIPAGLSCDGDSVALTAATQPAIEEIALGALPGLPNVKFHWPLIEYSLGGAEFLEAFFKAGRGELDPFVLVVEGSIPNEEIKKEGYWSGFGNKPGHRPADDLQRLDRPARAQSVGGSCRRERARRTAASTRWPAIRRARWAFSIIWVGIGNRVPACRSFAFRAARFSPITSRKRFSICCGKPPAARR